MRKMILFGVIGLWASVLLAGGGIQPLNIKPGLWQDTMTSATTGAPPIPQSMLDKMTPEQRARLDAAMKARAGGQPMTYKTCLTQDDINKDPFKNDKRNCTRTVLGSTSSTMDIHEVCTEKNGAKIDGTVHVVALDPEHVKATVHGTAVVNGRTTTVDSTVTGKWLTSACTK